MIIQVTISENQNVINIEMDNFFHTFQYKQDSEDDCQQCAFLKIKCQKTFMHFACCTPQYRDDKTVGCFLPIDKDFDRDKFSIRFLEILKENKENINVIKEK